MNKSIRLRGGHISGEPFDVTVNFREKDMKDMKDLKGQEFREWLTLNWSKHRWSTRKIAELWANQVTEELQSKLSNLQYWVEEERKGRERMRRLYAEKLEENTKLKEGVKEIGGMLNVLALSKEISASNYKDFASKLEQLLNESNP